MHDGERDDWKVHLIDTGVETQTGGRLKRLAGWLSDGTFLMTYGDGVANIDIRELVEFHRSHGRLATVTAVRPPARFGGMDFDGDLVAEFTEKPQIGEGWINGGFFVLEPKVLDYIDDDATAFEREPLEQARRGQSAGRLSARRVLAVHGHAPRRAGAQGDVGKRRCSLEGVGMRILVTGHHGYIGSITSSVLAAAGNDVVGLDTFFYSGCDFAASECPVPSITADVRDLGAEQLSGYDAIVHLAALSNDPLGDLDPSLTDEINFRASLSLARSAKQAGVKRFVFASSCSMYGLSTGAEDVDESAPLSPLTPYAASKVRAEEALLLLADDNFTPIFMRNATAFGVSPRLRADVVLNNLAGWAHTTSEIRILSEGTPGDRSFTLKTSRARLSLCSTPHASSCMVRLSTSGVPIRTIRCASWRRSFAPPGPNAASRSPAAATRTHEVIVSASQSLRTPFPTSSSVGRRRRERRSCSTPMSARD